MKNKIAMENLNLIRKIAWSYSTTTGLDINDLIQEASLAYLECLNKYDPSKGKLSVFAWRCMQHHLNYYIDKELRQPARPVIQVEENPVSVCLELFESFTQDAGYIAKLIVSSGRKYIGLKSDEAQERIRRVLKKNGWTDQRITVGLKDVERVLSSV